MTTAIQRHPQPGLLAKAFVWFYRLWHGRLHFKGAGYLLQRASHVLPGLQRYTLEVPGVGTIPVDLRDYGGRLWLQQVLGDELAPFDVEDGLSRAITRVLGDGEVFWDIGGNVGMVTAAIARQYPRARIFTFEPNPFLCSSLETLFSRYANIKVLPFAFSDADGELTLTIPKRKSVGASVKGLNYVLETGDLNEDDVIQHAVRGVTGDSLLKLESKVLPPQVIKIDVEGHEGPVIRGLADTILRYQPVIFFEHLYLSDTEIAGLVPAGYALHSVVNENGTLTGEFDRSAGHNSVLIPRPSPRETCNEG